MTSRPTLLKSIYDGSKVGMKGPTYTRFIDNGLGFYFKDPLKDIKYTHKGAFLRKVIKLLHVLESQVLGFGSHNDIHPYTSPHSRVQVTWIVRVMSDNNQYSSPGLSET